MTIQKLIDSLEQIKDTHYISESEIEYHQNKVMLGYFSVIATGKGYFDVKLIISEK
jgi:hypothetical protein